MDKVAEKKNLNPHSQKNHEALSSCAYNLNFLIAINNEDLATTPPGVITDKIKKIQNENTNNIIVTFDDIIYMVKKYISFLVKLEIERENLLSEIKAASIHIIHINNLLNNPSLEENINKLINEDIKKQLNKLDKLLDDLIKESMSAINDINIKLTQTDRSISVIENKIIASENKIKALYLEIFTDLDIDKEYIFNVEMLVDNLGEIDKATETSIKNISLSRDEIRNGLAKRFESSKDMATELNDDYFEKFITNLIGKKVMEKCNSSKPGISRNVIKNFLAKNENLKLIKNISSDIKSSVEKSPKNSSIKNERINLNELKSDRSMLKEKRKSLLIEKTKHEMKIDHYIHKKELIAECMNPKINPTKILNDSISDITSGIPYEPSIKQNEFENLITANLGKLNFSKDKDVTLADCNSEDSIRPKF